jgi:hypothetical protein
LSLSNVRRLINEVVEATVAEYFICLISNCVGGLTKTKH